MRRAGMTAILFANWMFARCRGRAAAIVDVAPNHREGC
jgi:hypothetical protein